MNTLISRLRETAKAEGLAREAREEVFHLLQEEQCQKCCLLGSGGIDTKPSG